MVLAEPGAQETRKWVNVWYCLVMNVSSFFWMLGCCPQPTSFGVLLCRSTPPVVDFGPSSSILHAHTTIYLRKMADLPAIIAQPPPFLPDWNPTHSPYRYRAEFESLGYSHAMGSPMGRHWLEHLYAVEHGTPQPESLIASRVDVRANILSSESVAAFIRCMYVRYRTVGVVEIKTGSMRIGR